jgi:putative sterol carrier protein
MPKELLSEEWITEYAALWNDEPTIREGVEDLSVTIVYRVAEDPEVRAAQIDLEKGEVVYAGPKKTETPDFLLTATVENWRKFGTGDLRIQKALTFRKIKFEGPVMVALTHLQALEAALLLFGKVTDTAWS